MEGSPWERQKGCTQGLELTASLFMALVRVGEQAEPRALPFPPQSGLVFPVPPQQAHRNQVGLVGPWPRKGPTCSLTGLLLCQLLGSRWTPGQGHPGTQQGHYFTSALAQSCFTQLPGWPECVSRQRHKSRVPSTGSPRRAALTATGRARACRGHF